MAVDKLVVKLDATQIFPVDPSLTWRDQITVAATKAKAITNGLWIEPYTNSAMIEPKQFKQDFYLDNTVPRFGKSRWILTDGHWEQIARGEDVFLSSDGTDESILTLYIFPANRGYCLDFFLYGSETDVFDALHLWVGQWHLRIRSDGYTKLYGRGAGEDLPPRAYGWLTHRQGEGTLCNRKSRLVIMPTGDGTLYIRRNGLRGFTYKLPDDEIDPLDPQIIEGGYWFELKAIASKIEFQLTELAFPTTGDFYYISPNRQLPKPPAADQTVSIEDDWLNLGGGVTAQVYEGLEEGEGYAELVPFVPDGVKDTYCLGIIFNASSGGWNSPFYQGSIVTFPKGTDAEPVDPNDITADVVECTITAGEDPFQSEATIKIRDVDAHPILGKCNRRCAVKFGTQVVFDGVLAEPPRKAYSKNQAPCYELKVASLLKYVDQPILDSLWSFDNHSHTEVVRWLVTQKGGLADSLLITDTDETPLRDTQRQKAGQEEPHSELRPKPADSPREWIEKVCQESGWRFYDGPDDAGDWALHYRDPLTLSTTPVHVFYVKTAETGGPEEYDLIKDSMELWDVEPEGNEIHVLGCNLQGEVIDAVYADLASQDPTLAEEERPVNWLGFTKKVVLVLRGLAPDDLLQRFAVRVGQELSKSVRMAGIHADWHPGLWPGVVVDIDDGTEDTGASGTYRLVTMNLSFEHEAADVPVRRANYTAVKIETGYAARARAYWDQRIVQQMGWYLRFGPQAKEIEPISEGDGPGNRDKSASLSCEGPVKRIITLLHDDGLEEFVLGANALDATTYVS